MRQHNRAYANTCQPVEQQDDFARQRPRGNRPGTNRTGEHEIHWRRRRRE